MPRPLSYLTPDSPQKQGKSHERKVRQTISSGAVWFDKGDVDVKDTDDNYVVDSKKVVTQKTYTFSLKEVDKFYKQVGGTRTPVYMIYLGDYCLKCIVQHVGKQ